MRRSHGTHNTARKPMPISRRRCALFSATGAYVAGSCASRATIDPRNVDDKVTLNCARTNYFPVAGLARAQFDKDGNVSAIAPAFARARADGSWSDSLRVSTALQVRPMQ